MKYLAIGSGGFGIFAYMGYVYKIRDQLKDVEEISGASAGGMLGLLLASGKSIDDIITFLFNLDFKKYYTFSVRNFINYYGFIDNNEIKDDFIKFLGGNPTFKELDKKLIVSALNVNHSITEYFSVDNYPDMHALDAVCMSMSIPFIFTAKPFNSNYYVDGGLFEKVPLGYFLGRKREDVLGIDLECKLYNNKNISSFKDYLFFIYNAFVNNSAVKENDKMFNIVKIIQDDNINLLDFKMSDDDKMRLFFIGYNSKL